MSGRRDLAHPTLEAVNRLGATVADLMEASARQHRDVLDALAGIDARLGSVDGAVSRLAASVRSLRGDKTDGIL